MRNDTIVTLQIMFSVFWVGNAWLKHDLFTKGEAIPLRDIRMKSFCLMLVIFGLLLCGVTSVVAGEVFTVITSEQLKARIDCNEPDLVLVDTRSSGEYQEAHIKGAVSIPWANLEKNPAALNFPKESKVLFYCTGAS